MDILNITQNQKSMKQLNDMNITVASQSLALTLTGLGKFE